MFRSHGPETLVIHILTCSLHGFYHSVSNSTIWDVVIDVSKKHTDRGGARQRGGWVTVRGQNHQLQRRVGVLRLVVHLTLQADLPSTRVNHEIGSRCSVWNLIKFSSKWNYVIDQT